MNQGDTETVEYFLVFCKTTLKHWVFRFIDPELQHVYAMRLSPGGQFWTIVHPHKSHIAIETELYTDFPHPRLYAGNDAVILPVRAKICKDTMIYGAGIMCCVSVVKALLGIKKRTILTPYQLYKYLTGGMSHG